MNLPYQAPAVDRANRFDAAMQSVDPALFGLSWGDVAGGVKSALDFIAPHAKHGFKEFASSAIDSL